MKSLRKLQLEFLAALNDSQNDVQTDIFLQNIAETAELLRAQRLSIYRDSMIEGFVTALQDTYPVCRKLVGDEFFYAMAKRFASITPSHTPDLGDYGETFAEFIANFPPAAGLPYLADVARLEWAWSRAFHGAPSLTCDYEALAKIPEDEQEQIIFYLPSNTTLITSPFPIHRIWQVNQNDYKGDHHVELNAGRVQLFVWRDANLTVYISELTTQEWDLLNAIQQGRKLGEFTEKMLGVLPQLVQRNWLGGFQ